MSRRHLRPWLFVIAALGIAPLAGTWAEGPRDASVLDRQLSDALRDMHNKAADLFNGAKDYNGAYRMFQGGLYVVRPMLNHRPDVQAILDQGLQEADRVASLPDRAMRLHKTIEDIRAKLRPGGDAKPADKTGPTPAPTPPSNPPNSTPPPPIAPEKLWTRLGGEARVKQVVDDFFTMVLFDPKIDFSRGGKFKFTQPEEEALKAKLVAFISAASEGPIPYTGKSMAEAHKGMNITAEQFDAFAASLRLAFKNKKVADADVDELMKKVEATRGDIVGK
jgi:hemoglobin